MHWIPPLLTPSNSTNVEETHLAVSWVFVHVFMSSTPVFQSLRPFSVNSSGRGGIEKGCWVTALYVLPQAWATSWGSRLGGVTLVSVAMICHRRLSGSRKWEGEKNSTPSSWCSGMSSDVYVILAFLLSWMRYECMAVMTSSYICDERSISMGHEVSDEGEPTSR